MANFIELSDLEIGSSQPESDEEPVVEISSFTSCDDDDEEDCDDDDDHDYDDGNGWKGSENEEEDDIHDEEYVCNKVTQFIRGKSSLKELKLVECRVFLRRHGLRLSGTKEECIERINELWRLVGLFVAQVWKNERERSTVLAEKHQRGAAARTVRAMRKSKMVTVTNKLGTCKKGAKRCKHFDHLDSSRTKEKIHGKKNHVNEHGKASALNNKGSHHQNSASFQASSSKKHRDYRESASYRRHQNPIQDNQFREPVYLPYNYPSQPAYHFQPDIPGRESNHFPRDSRYTLPYFHHFQDYVSEHQELSHGRFSQPFYSPSSHANESRNFHRPMDYQSFRPLSTDRWR